MVVILLTSALKLVESDSSQAEMQALNNARQSERLADYVKYILRACVWRQQADTFTLGRTHPTKTETFY